jgi:type II secretory pathway pseudopilin PulG
MRRGGFSLVETAIATLLVGGLLVTAMNMVGASRITQSRTTDRQHATLLADELLQEVLAQPYGEPNGNPLLGLDIGELLTLRVGFDDADDYDDYTESPPVDADGQPIPGAGRFTRRVEVRWVDPDEPDTVVASDQGLKRVTVTVTLADRQLAELVAYRSATWPDAATLAEGLP